MGGGKVRIVSWMHSQFCIACNHEGKVSTIGIGKAEEGCDEWTVEKAPEYQTTAIAGWLWSESLSAANLHMLFHT